MKKNDILLTALFICLCIFMTGCSTQINSTSVNNNESENISTLEKLPVPNLLLPASDVLKIDSFNSDKVSDIKISELKIYKKEKVDANIKLNELKKLYGLAEGTMENKDGLLRFYDENSMLTINETGGSYVISFNRDDVDIKKSISEEDAIEIVRKYVRSNNIRKETLKVLNVSKEIALTHVANGSETESISSITFYLVDNTTDNGYIDNSEPLIVSVNADGEITLIIENRTDKEEIGTYPIITKDEVIKKLSNGDAVVSGTKGSAKTAEITNMNITYFNNGPISDVDGGILQPIILVNGTLDGDKTQTFEAQVPALESGYYKTSNN